MNRDFSWFNHGQIMLNSHFPWWNLGFYWLGHHVWWRNPLPFQAPQMASAGAPNRQLGARVKVLPPRPQCDSNTTPEPSSPSALCKEVIFHLVWIYTHRDSDIYIDIYYNTVYIYIQLIIHICSFTLSFLSPLSIYHIFISIYVSMQICKYVSMQDESM